MKSTNLTVRQMQTDIPEALLNEIEHAGNFLLIQDEDIEWIKQRLQLLTLAD